MKNERILEISAGKELAIDTNSWYRFTKPTFLRVIDKDGRVVQEMRPTTWASLIRGVVSSLKRDIATTENFEEKFNSVMRELFIKRGWKFNSNFSETLFEDDSFITSSLYKSNQNHKLELCDGKYVCAVYTSEVIVVINGIIQVIGGKSKVVIQYFFRKEATIDEPDAINVAEEIRNRMEQRLDKSNRLDKLDVRAIALNMRKELDVLISKIDEVDML